MGAEKVDPHPHPRLLARPPGTAWHGPVWSFPPESLERGRRASHTPAPAFEGHGAGVGVEGAHEFVLRLAQGGDLGCS